MTDADSYQDRAIEDLQGRMRAVEEVVVELRTLTKLAKPIMLIAAAGLGVDIMPLLA